MYIVLSIVLSMIESWGCKKNAARRVFENPAHIGIFAELENTVPLTPCVI